MLISAACRLERKPYDSLVAEDEVIDPVHGSVGSLLQGKGEACCDLILGKPDLPGKRSFLFLRCTHASCPVHGGKIEPMIGPTKSLLDFCRDHLREECPIEGGVLADEDGPVSFDLKRTEKSNDLLGDCLLRFSLRDFFPGKVVDFQTF